MQLFAEGNKPEELRQVPPLAAKNRLSEDVAPSKRKSSFDEIFIENAPYLVYNEHWFNSQTCCLLTTFASLYVGISGMGNNIRPWIQGVEKVGQGKDSLLREGRRLQN